ncbi:group 1 glycosyl transferase [Candidatus Magnetobacterium bavaricum]|uniref:Group 1 glycosyl transferase n=1 Tax=Candidatus Magnetobacterium bavaricum TaxID=29290 RepID=A0A0F3GZM7_9BACT|nr:group 1 glycosyl transferase [Candidatus Magnetobacterium bavaricum]
MSIVIDGFPLMFLKTGIGFYVHNIVKKLVTLAPENDYYLYDALTKERLYTIIRVDRRLSALERFSQISSVQFPYMTAARAALFLSSLTPGRSRLNMDKADVFWGTNCRGIYKPRMKTVVTVHDMSHEYFPETFHPDVLSYLKRYLAEAASNAHTLIAVSENTKMDIVKFLHVDPSKIKVTHVGVSEDFHLIHDLNLLNAIKGKYNLPDNFVFALGTIQPRKNISRLLQAFAALCDNPSFKHRLVISGAYGWKNKDVYSSIAGLGITDRVSFTGYVAQGDLPVIYNLADVFVYPSLYEGFGSPVIEAMACGVPVVTSNVSSIPEVAGNCALLVNPTNVNDIAMAIEKILSDSNLRQSLTTQALQHVRKFTWQRCATETLAVLQGG